MTNPYAVPLLPIHHRFGQGPDGANGFCEPSDPPQYPACYDLTGAGDWWPIYRLSGTKLIECCLMASLIFEHNTDSLYSAVMRDLTAEAWRNYGGIRLE